MTGRGERSVAVYGATGHTGRFVIAELLRRGLEPVAVARDGATLAGSDLSARGVATRAASIDDAAALDRAFCGCRGGDQLRRAVLGYRGSCC